MTLDATYYKVRIDGVVRDYATLIAYGVRRDDGKRMILRNSTNIMGFSATSNPNARRISGGKVMDPRLETGIAVMLQSCIAA